MHSLIGRRWWKWNPQTLTVIATIENDGELSTEGEKFSKHNGKDWYYSYKKNKLIYNALQMLEISSPYLSACLRGEALTAAKENSLSSAPHSPLTQGAWQAALSSRLDCNYNKP